MRNDIPIRERSVVYYNAQVCMDVATACVCYWRLSITRRIGKHGSCQQRTWATPSLTHGSSVLLTRQGGGLLLSRLVRPCALGATPTPVSSVLLTRQRIGSLTPLRLSGAVLLDPAGIL